MTSIIAHEALLAAVHKRRLLPSPALSALAQRLAQAAPADPGALAAWLSRHPELPGINAADLAPARILSAPFPAIAPSPTSRPAAWG
jgi:hypothetical protein